MTDFKKYLLDEFVEDYQEGVLSRRDALKLIAGVTGSLTLATSILAACAPPEQPATPAPTTAPTPIPQATATAAATVAATATTAATNTPQPTDVPPAASGDIEASDIEFDGADGAKLLAHLARPAAERRRMRQTCVQTARTHLTLARHLDQHLAIYQEVLRA